MKTPKFVIRAQMTLGSLNDFGLFWINKDTAETLGIFSSWVWEWMGASCCCRIHQLGAENGILEAGFSGIPCWLWMSWLAGAQGWAGTLCDPQDWEFCGNSWPCSGWVRFGLGSDPTQPNPSVFLECHCLCVPPKTGENCLELMGFAQILSQGEEYVNLLLR